MNFLAGVQRLCRECGVGNVTTTINQSGEARRMVDWYNSAWMDIQGTRRDWGWMRASASFVTVDGQASYAIGTAAGEVGVSAASFGSWVKDSFRSYLTASGTSAELFMGYMEYDDWRTIYQFSSARTTKSQPTRFTITPAKAIGLGSVPLVGYTVTGDYFACPTEMAADADIPSLPAHYHLAIVYRAMMMYGAFEAATEVYQRGASEFKLMMNRIENDRTPDITVGGEE